MDWPRACFHIIFMSLFWSWWTSHMGQCDELPKVFLHATDCHWESIPLWLLPWIPYNRCILPLQRSIGKHTWHEILRYKYNWYMPNLLLQSWTNHPEFKGHSCMTLPKVKDIGGIPCESPSAVDSNITESYAAVMNNWLKNLKDILVRLFRTSQTSATCPHCLLIAELIEHVQIWKIRWW